MVLAMIGGCADSSDRLVAWTFSGRPVVLPAHVTGAAPHEEALVLETEVRREAADPAPTRLVFAELQAPARLFVDGELATALEPARGYRHIGPARFALPAGCFDDGVAHLRLEIEDTWAQAGWLDAAPILQTGAEEPSQITRSRVLHGPMAWAGGVALLQVALTCLFIYLLDRKRRPYLWFGLQAVTAAVYCAFVAGLIERVAGALDTPIVGIALTSALVVSIYFTRTFFELGPPSRVWVVAMGVSHGVMLAFTGPHLATRVAGALVIVIGITVIVYQVSIAAYLVARHRDRVSASLLLAAWVALACTAWVDFLRWSGLVAGFGGLRFGPIGLGLFALFLALLLSRSHSLSLRHADALNTQLVGQLRDAERRAREIRALNEELRRQIGERSEQLVSVLTQMGGDRELPDLKEGELVQGRYRVERELGSGGMGVVWEVSRVSDGARFALKRTLERDGPSLARLAREASIASRVDHPNITRIVDVDVASEGYLYLVMELAPGDSLRAHSDRYGERPFALAVLEQMAAGLSALHEAGITHRDLKPANVMVDATPTRPRVWITDFGVSRARVLEEVRERTPIAAESTGAITLAAARPRAGATPERVALTQPGHLPGTPLYMAPECATGDAAPAIDIFAFGIIARELLVRRRPFLESVALRLIEREPFPEVEPLRALWPEAPAELASLLDACLAEHPRARPSAPELARALADAEQACAAAV